MRNGRNYSIDGACAMCMDIIKNAVGRLNRTNCIDSFANIEKKMQCGQCELVLTKPLLLIEKNTSYNRLYYFRTNVEATEDYVDVVRNLGRFTNLYADVTTKSAFQYDGSIFEKMLFKPYRLYVRKIAKKTEKKFREMLTPVFADIDDFDEIQRMLLDSFDVMCDHIPLSEELKGFLNERKILKIAIQKEIAGVLIFDDIGAQSYARCLCVSSKFQNGFVGYSLLARYFNDRLESGVKFYYLWVDSNNESVKKLHDAFGYHEDGLKNYIFKRG